MPWKHLSFSDGRRIIKKKIHEHKLSILVDSAGTSAHHVGQAPDARMIETGRKNGTDISDLQARQFTAKDFDVFDRIYVMDESNLKNVLHMANNDSHKNKARLILSTLKNQTDPAVPDPYYGSAQDFQHVYELLDKATDAVLIEITND